MKIKELKEFLPYAFKVKAAVMVHGHHGIGKSQAIKQFALENGKQFIDRRLSQMESGDLLGLPDLSDGTTKFIVPSWLPRDPKSKGVLFLDEINRARPDVLQGVFQLVLDRQLGDYTLPEGWDVIAAVNPNTDDYHVTNVFDKALLDRFLHVKLTPSTEEFIAFAQKQEDLDQNFVAFLQAREEMIEESKLQAVVIDRRPSRRSNIMAARLIAAGLPDSLMFEGVGGLIGAENVTAFTTWLKENEIKPFTAKEVFSDFEKIRERMEKYADATSGRHDVLTASCDNVFNELESNFKKIKPKQMDNLFIFMEKLPKDLAFTFVKRVIDCKADGFSAWALPTFLDDARTNWITEINKPTAETQEAEKQEVK